MKKYILFILIFIFISNSVESQSTVVRKVITESGEYVSENALRLIGKRSSKELIDAYSVILIKNGFGVKTRIGKEYISSFLLETYNLRGKEDLIRVGQKLSTLGKSNNLNNIKGFLAEEMHHNALLKIEGVKNVKGGVKFKTSNFVQQKHQIFVQDNILKNKNLYVHKNIEIDLLAEKGNSSFMIEVKNVDSNFGEQQFLEYYSQLVKQKAFAQENGIKKVFWSNIGTGKLTENQKNEIERLGVFVVQSGKDNPRINAYLNMTLIKLELQKLN